MPDNQEGFKSKFKIVGFLGREVRFFGTASTAFSDKQTNLIDELYISTTIIKKEDLENLINYLNEIKPRFIK